MDVDDDKLATAAWWAIVRGQPELPKVGEVLDLSAGDWSYMDDRIVVLPGERALRLRVSAVDEASALWYCGARCWVAGVELDERDRPVRCVDALVPVRRSGAGGVTGDALPAPRDAMTMGNRRVPRVGRLAPSRGYCTVCGTPCWARSRSAMTPAGWSRSAASGCSP